MCDDGGVPAKCLCRRKYGTNVLINIRASRGRVVNATVFGF